MNILLAGAAAVIMAGCGDGGRRTAGRWRPTHCTLLAEAYGSQGDRVEALRGFEFSGVDAAGAQVYAAEFRVVGCGE